MKKLTVLLTSFIFLNLNIFAQSYNNEPILSIGFTNPKIDINIQQNEELSKIIRNQFEKIFRDYTTITVYDIENEKSLIELNQEHGTIGMLETASNRATSSLNFRDSNVFLNLQITNIRTSAIIATSTNQIPASNLSDQEKLNSLIGRVAVEILQQLNVNLSTSQIMIIRGQKSESEMTSEEIKNSIAEQEKILRELEDKINLEKSKTNKTDNSSMDLLEIQRNRLEQKLKLQQKRYEQKQRDEANLAQEAEISLKRSKEQNAIIEKQRQEYEKKANQLRNFSFAQMDSENQIEIIEQNKQTILAMRKKMKESIFEFETLTNKNAQEDCEKIDSEPFSLVDKDAQGNPLPRILQERQTRKNAIKQEAVLKIESYKKQLNSQQIEFEKKLNTEIQNDYKMLKKTQSVSSINKQNLLRINNYDGGLYGWETTIYFELGDNIIASYNSFLPYKSLFNKSPKIKSEEYKNNVEEYDSYFRSNIPVIYAVVDYYIIPRETYPSEYIVNIVKTSFYNIDTGEKILTQNHKNLSGYYKYAIISDIRSSEEILKDKKLQQKNFEKEFKSQQKNKYNIYDDDYFSNSRSDSASSNSSTKSSSKNLNSRSSQSFFTPQNHAGIVNNIQFNLDNLKDYRFSGAVDFPLDPFFWGLGGSLKYETNPNQKNSLDKVFNEFDMDFALRLGLQLYGIHRLISPYFIASLGINYDFINRNNFYFVQGTFGLTFFLFFDVNYICKYNFSDGSIHNAISAGLSIFGPWGKSK